jgi:hypothetical protein
MLREPGTIAGAGRRRNRCKRLLCLKEKQVSAIERWPGDHIQALETEIDALRSSAGGAGEPRLQLQTDRIGTRAAVAMAFSAIADIGLSVICVEMRHMRAVLKGRTATMHAVSRAA